MAKNITTYVWWKDKNLLFAGCNKNLSLTLGLNTSKSLIGSSDFDLPWKTEAEHYRKVDKLILEGHTLLNSKESRWTVNGLIPLIVNKMPLRSGKGKIMGVLGIYQALNNAPATWIQPTALTHEELPNHESELLITLKTMLDNSLTIREIECISLWVSGVSIKVSAVCLKVSEKSIEAYRNRILNKLDIHNKNQLIDLIESKGILNLFLLASKLIQARTEEISLA